MKGAKSFHREIPQFNYENQPITQKSVENSNKGKYVC